MAGADINKTDVRLQDLQRDVDETAELMRDNINAVVERGDKLDELNDRADNLQVHSRQFESTGRRIKKKYWWKDKKRLLCIIGLVVAAVVIIIIIIVVSLRPWQWGNNESLQPTPVVTTPAVTL